MVSWGEFRGALLALGGLLVVVLAVIIIEPGLPGELLLQTLRFHLAAGGVVLALLVMLAGARWRGFLLLLLVLGSAAHGANLLIEFQNRRVDHAAAPLATLDFLSFNVLARNPQAEELVQSIIDEPPDVLLVMETPGIRPYLDRLATVLPYRIGCAQPERCDISLHSRIPFDDAEIMDLPPLGRQRLVTARLTVDGQGVTFVGVHLTKPYYDNFAELELWRIDRVLRNIEGPLVLAGDFNSASWFTPLATIGRRNDLAPGPTQPPTWPVRLRSFGVPIDNIFTRGAAQIITIAAGENHGSNHRPLRAEIGLYDAE